MVSELKPIAGIYGLNTNLMGKALSNINEDESAKRFKNGTNNLKWIVAHIATTRASVAGMLGQEAPMPWGQKFMSGIDEIDEFPSVQEIEAAWNGATEALNAGLESANAERLAQDPPFQVPLPEQSIMSAVAFLAQHESYHVGQISYVRRLVSEEGLFKLL